MLMVRVVPVFLLACANAGGSSPPVDSRGGIDAPRSIDAPKVVDAPVVIDAPVAIDAPVDAPGSGLFCNSNAECTNSGECCLKVDSSTPGFCVEGMVIVTVCLPNF